MQSTNWIIDKYKVYVDILSFDFPSYLQNICKIKNIPISNMEKKFIAWEKVDPSFSFFYDFKDCELAVSEMLYASSLFKQEKLIMDFGYNGPIIQVLTSVFIKNWYDFVKGATYETTVISQDGKLFMEFTRDDYLLFSNFRIGYEQ